MNSTLPGLENVKERGEMVFKGVDPYEDDRGVIMNYHLPEAINLVGTITSKAGIMRANHYHPVQEQKVILLSGKFISVYKDLLIDGEIKSHVIEAGDMVVTPPMVAHTMIFLEDSVFVNLVNGNRDHDKFNVEHTMSYQLVSEEQKQSYIDKHSA